MCSITEVAGQYVYACGGCVPFTECTTCSSNLCNGATTQAISVTLLLTTMLYSLLGQGDDNTADNTADSTADNTALLLIGIGC